MADNELSKLLPPSVTRMQWPQTFEGKNQTHIGGIGSLSYYHPTPRDRLIGVLHEIYGNSPEARNRIDNMMQRVDFFASAPFGAYDAIRAVGEGRYKDAILPGIAAVAPFMDKPIKLFANAIGGRFGGAARELEEASDLATQVAGDALGRADDFGNQASSALGSRSKLDDKLQERRIDTTPNNRSATNTVAQKPTKETNRSIVLPNTRIMVPRPSIIRPDTSLVMPSPPIIQSMSGPRDWIDEAEFRKSAVPGGRTTPRVVPTGPLAKVPRDSILDYPNGAIVDENGNLRHDIDGREFITDVIAGRRRLGEKDVGLTGDQVRRILGNLNVHITKVPRDSIRKRGLGQYWPDWDPPGRIDIWEGLPDDQADVVLGHEFGHLVDRMLGYPVTRGLDDELDTIYSENKTGQLNPPHRVHPRDEGYREDEYRGEKMAEAIRTQIFLPNTIKTIAPKTAALLRAEINTHPILSKLFQVNGIPVGILAGAGAAAMMGTPSESQAGQLADSDTSVPEMKINLRKIAAALPGPVRRRPIPATLELIARTLMNPRARPSHGGPH